MQDTVDKSAAPRQAGIQAIARAGRVLRALEDAPDGLGLAELADRVELPKSTVHRLVGALAREELTANTPDGRIVLGSAIARMAGAGRAALPARLRPVLEELSRETGETVDLAVLDGASVRFVDQLAGPQRLRAVSAVGAEFPVHCTANGKALLAALGPDAARWLLSARLKRYTPATVTSRAVLIEELATVSSDGVAYDREEHTEGICAVGAAVLDASGPVAALSVPVPSARFAREEKRYAQAVRTAAERASTLLGAP